MAGLYTGDPIDSATERAQGVNLISSSLGEQMAAEFQSGMAATPTARLGRLASSYDPNGEMLTPEQANARYPGVDFKSNTADSVASSLYKARQDQAMRDSIIARGPGGVIAGIGGFGSRLLPQMFDPLNVASMFVPGLGETRAAAILGRAGIESTLATRALAGASQGMAGQALLEPTNAALDHADQNDWSMSRALIDIGLGSLFGGGLHAAGGAIADRLGVGGAASQPAEDAEAATEAVNPIAQRMEAAGPLAHDAAMREGIAALVEDRPNIVSEGLGFQDSLLHQNETANVSDELAGWQRQQEGLSADQDGLLNEAATTDEAASAQNDRARASTEDLQGRADALQTEHDQLGQEAQAARDRYSRQVEDTTGDRITAIRDELAQDSLPAARREALEAELRMVTEGGGQSAADRALEMARTLAHAGGLERRQSALAKQIRQIQSRMKRVRVAGPDVWNTPEFRAAAARIQSRQDVLHALTHRSLGRYARRIGSSASDRDLAALARSVLQATGDDRRPAIAAALDQVRGARGPRSLHYLDRVAEAYQGYLRSTAGSVAETGEPEIDAAQNILNAPNQQAAAMDALRRSALADQPEIQAARRSVDQGAQGAPEADTSDPARELAEARAAYEQDRAEFEASATDEERKALAAIDTEFSTEEGDARAIEAATLCMAGRL